MRMPRWATIAPAACACCLALDSSRITVRLYESTGLPESDRRAMEAETARIFRAAGVELEWVECEVRGRAFPIADCGLTAGPGRLVLHLAGAGSGVSSRALGISGGFSACVYSERVAELAQRANWL